MHENFFLPSELIPNDPEYFVWYTGTLGQAEWLISYSRTLRGTAVPKECRPDLSNVPEAIMPLLSLDQPDLIVTNKKNDPLILIEITEQRAFGTNAPQRVARFWSAVANRIPSAYILPVESYQIEKSGNPLKMKKILEEQDVNKKRFLLFCETLLRVNGEKTYRNGITTIEELKERIRRGEYKQIAGITEHTITQLQQFVKKFVDGEGETVHLQNIPPEEYCHRVGNTYYRAYIRKPEITESMLLEWFHVCSTVVPTFVFKWHSELKYLFRTNGLTHIMYDEENPFLSYRNLPPKPGQNKVVHTFCGNNKDEIELFFNFVDACIHREFSNDFFRKKVMRAGEYWNNELRTRWFKEIEDIRDIDLVKSGNFSCTTQNFFDFLESQGVEIPQKYEDSFQVLEKSHIYKIFNAAPHRGLYDPYSGNLAVRDILFAREPTTIEDLTKFTRSKSLVFLVDFKGESATKHRFIYGLINRAFTKYNNQKDTGWNEQEKLLWLLKNIKIHKFTKDMRCHIVFSDIILVRRFVTPDPIKYEVIFGVPTLLRMGLIDERDASIESMRLKT